jgi:PadR family transcriptional regulator
MANRSLVAASLQPLLLSLLDQGEAYGYQILQRIKYVSGGTIEWTAGTIYPVLHRMETDGLIQATWRPSESGPRRKYYRLTGKGRRALDTEKQSWIDVHLVLERLWEGKVSFG